MSTSDEAMCVWAIASQKIPVSGITVKWSAVALILASECPESIIISHAYSNAEGERKYSKRKQQQKENFLIYLHWGNHLFQVCYLGFPKC